MARPRKNSSFTNPEKVGLTQASFQTRSEFLKNYYQRKQILTVPKEILDSNPDKHFLFVNLPKLQKSGGWHKDGYRLFEVPNDSETLRNIKFDTPLDRYVHRNEMALAWIPKEEYERRQLELEVVRGKKDLTALINRNPILQGFAPHAKETKEKIEFPTVVETQEL